MTNLKLRGKDQLQLTEIRKVTGAWLREKREQVGLSQKDLAILVDIEYYTFISQIETGRGKIPSNKYAAYADALEIPHREFAIEMLRCRDPELYDMIFGDHEAGANGPSREPLKVVNDADDSIELRLAKLEALLTK